MEIDGYAIDGDNKKAGNYYVALCLELNVSSQGESIEGTRRMLQEACEEYLSYIKEEKLEYEIRPAPLEVLREFLVEDVEHVRPSHDWVYSENITLRLVPLSKKIPAMSSKNTSVGFY